MLIVEDEPYMAEAIRDGLRLEAIAADIAGDGHAALELLGGNAYDIAVLDRDIPGPTGDEIAGRIVADAKAAKRRLPGFGHRVHTNLDPRVDVLFTLAEETHLSGDGIRFTRALETAMRARIKPIPLNIDGALAAVLFDLGLPSKVGRLMFIVGRVAGLSAEVLEEHTREKTMRIKIPVAYDGVPPRKNGQRP